MTAGRGPGPDGSDRETWVWIDGRLVDADHASVSVFDHGLTVGDGVFETLRVVEVDDGDDRPFALAEHLDRLARSMATLGLPTDGAGTEHVRRDVLTAAVHAVIRANGGARHAGGRVRITVTGGPAPLGSGRGAAPLTAIVASGPATVWPATSSVAVVPWRRNEHGAATGLKSTSYAENVIALARAHHEGADEAVFANTAGNLCEGTGSNVFVVHDGRLVTPPLSAGCLAGVTRALVLDLLRAAPIPGVDVVEADLPIAAVIDAPEAFLTSSTRDVHPVATVDGVALPAAPGPVTTEVMARFAGLLAAAAS